MLLGALWITSARPSTATARTSAGSLPHWEKTLVDNALILDMITSVWQFNRNKLCEARIGETIEFLLRDMRNGAAFASSIDSDSEGFEGRYYVWTEAEIDAALMGTFVAKYKTVFTT